MASFYQRFASSAARYPSNIAVELQLAEPETRVVSHTYAELRRMAESVARWLDRSEVPAGARCAILGANSPRWAAAYLGVLARGAVAVPLDTAFYPEQIAKLLNDCGASVFFTDLRNLDSAREALKEAAGVRLVLLEKPPDAGHDLPTLDQMFEAGPGRFVPLDCAPKDLAVILYTSGTTSDPKGVMLTHGNLHAEAEAVFGFIRVNEKDALLGVLPLFHALAQMANLLLPYSVGARVVYMEQLNTTELLRALRERQITLFCCVPQFFYLIHEKVMKQAAQLTGLKRTAFQLMFTLSRWGRALGINLGRLFFGKAHKALGPVMRYLITGGSRFDFQIGRDLETLGFDILQAYGLTETSGGATVTTLGARFIGAVGKALPTTELKIVDAGLGDIAVAEGAQPSGEVLIRGPIIMKGYYNRPDATAEVLKDGWLYTGDLGYLDSENNLFITGRKKEVIVLSNGKNIYPEEIESHYLQSQWIKEICVMGLRSRPGEPFSERLHAVVVPNFDVLREKKIVNMKEVIRFDIEGLSSHIASTKRILSYDIWQTELPRTTTRKLKRFQIQKMVESKSGSDAAASSAKPRELTTEEKTWLEQPDVAKAYAVVRSASKKGSEIFPTDNLELDLGLDSMERVELVVALEHALNAKADENMISTVYTVHDLIETVRAGIGADGARVRAGWEEVFATESDDPDVLAITEPRPVATKLWFWFGCMVKLVSKTFFRATVTGVEKLPKEGPYILCPNHQSFLDGPIVTAQVPEHIHSELFYVGTSEIFAAGFMRSLARSIRLIPVDPDSNLVPAMRAGSYGLKKGKILVLYPEGERTIDGQVKTFKKGAAILAIHHQVPIVPVAIEGFHEAWPRGRNFTRFHRLQISFGDPIYPPANNGNSEAASEKLTAELRARVMEMWEPMHAKNPSSSNGTGN